MTPRQSRVLLAAAAWTLYVWISRAVILLGQDESAAFKAVHFVLAGVSIAFALAVGWIGLTARRSRQAGSPPLQTQQGEAVAAPARAEGAPPTGASSS